MTERVTFSTVIRLKASSSRYALVLEGDQLAPISTPLVLPVAAMLETDPRRIRQAANRENHLSEVMVSLPDARTLRLRFGSWVARCDLLQEVDSALARVLGAAYSEEAQKAARHGFRFNYLFEVGPDGSQRLNVVWKVLTHIALRKACHQAAEQGRIHCVTASDILRGHANGINIDPRTRCLIPSAE